MKSRYALVSFSLRVGSMQQKMRGWAGVEELRMSLDRQLLHLWDTLIVSGDEVRAGGEPPFFTGS